jgi:hypothetical protein
MFNEEETFFLCPYCGQSISMVLETLFGQQDYIEDCEVCCQPIQVSYDVSEDEQVVDLRVERAD